MTGAEAASSRAFGSAHTMQTEAAFEGKPNHVRHVQNQIDYTNAVAEAYNARWEQWASSDLPKLIDERIAAFMKNSTIEPKVDEKSLQACKKKITAMLDSIFR